MNKEQIHIALNKNRETYIQLGLLQDLTKLQDKFNPIFQKAVSDHTALINKFKECEKLLNDMSGQIEKASNLEKQLGTSSQDIISYRNSVNARVQKVNDYLKKLS